MSREALRKADAALLRYLEICMSMLCDDMEDIAHSLRSMADDLPAAYRRLKERAAERAAQEKTEAASIERLAQALNEAPGVKDLHVRGKPFQK